MSHVAVGDLPELVGFFSYSREDDEDSNNALSALRDRIQRELRSQLGRSIKTFRLWQDKEAIASGKLWEAEITAAVAESVFFIPIITPTAVQSPHCRFELEAFLAREAALDRDDLVFPILYIRVPALEDDARQKSDPVLSIIAKRQYVDWRAFRHRDVNSPDVRETIERFCRNISDALFRVCLSPKQRKENEEAILQRLQVEQFNKPNQIDSREKDAAKDAQVQRPKNEGLDVAFFFAFLGALISLFSFLTGDYRLVLIGGLIAVVAIAAAMIVFIRDKKTGSRET